MTKRIYLIRHAQAEHNVAEDYSIPDAKLTPLGTSQARDLLSNNPRLASAATRPQVLFTSPLTRTIQTTLLGFKSHKDASLNSNNMGENSSNVSQKHTSGSQNNKDKTGQDETLVIPIAELQENSAMPCDTGSALDVISHRFPELDFSRVPHDWTSKAGIWEDSQTALAARAQKVRNMLAARKEDRIAIITHGGFCSHLIGQYTRFNNAECREFNLVLQEQDKWVFVPASDAEEARIEQQVEQEAKEDSATFAETEMPTKI